MLLYIQLNRRVSLVSAPGYRSRLAVQEIKMHASKRKQRINSSINCSSEQRSLERLHHACDKRKHGTIHLMASWGFTARMGQGCTSTGELESSQTPALGSRLLTPWPPDNCKEPVRERKSTQIRWRTLSYQTSQISVALHHLLHTLSLISLPSSPTPASVLQQLRFATHWSTTSFKQPVSILPAHPNYNCTVKRSKSYLKKQPRRYNKQ